MSCWILFEITRNCNRSCRYCYNPDRRSPSTSALDHAHFEALLDRLCGRDAPEGVTIIGGEPLLVRELDDVIRGFRNRGLRVGLSTNGLLLSKNRIESLLEAGVSSFEISLDSLEPSVHLTLTGAEGMDRVRSAIVNLGLKRAAVSVGAVLSRPMVGGLEKLLDLCLAFSVKRLVLAQLAQVGFAKSQAANLSLTDLELREVFAFVNSRGRDLQVCIGLPVEPCRIDRHLYPNLQFEVCRCGIDKWVLEPNGDVRTCELATESVGNIFDKSLAQVAASGAVSFFRERNRYPTCPTCEDWGVCHGGCRFLR